MWQRSPGQWWRLDRNQTYGTDGAATSINAAMEPWAGGAGLRPWAPPDNEQVSKTSKDITVVIPPFYDTLPSTVEVNCTEYVCPGTRLSLKSVIIWSL